MLLNLIPFSEALKELGEEQEAGDLARLRRFYEIGTFDPQARRCSSIITRGEAQIFTASIPRFAVRVYLENHLGFVNCRRIATYLEQTSHNGTVEWGGRRDPVPEGMTRNHQLATPLEHRLLRDIVAGDSCIADSLLAPPARLNGFDIKYIPISSHHLPASYCECGQGVVAERSYLPYLKTFNLGGGMCSQAVAFMATAALAQYARFVCGIPEITAWAHSAKCAELSLSGLTPQMMDQYFDKVDLKLTEQFSLARDPGNLDARARELLAAALRAYLESGFPVIVPVDQYRMVFGCERGEPSVYENNGLEVTSPTQHFNAPHSIILFGAGKHERGDVFAFHDPAAMPYMVLSLEELCRIGAVYPDSATADNGVFMPVTPKPIVVPLLCQRHYFNSPTGKCRQISAGLFPMVSRFHKEWRSARIPVPANQTLGAFRLHRPMDSLAIPSIVTDRLRTQLLNSFEEKLRKICEAFEFSEEHWFWLEFFPESVWVWDAEQVLPDVLPNGDDPSDNLLKTVLRFLPAVVMLDNEALSILPRIS